MLPLEISAVELRQFELLLKRIGADPRAFKMKKFGSADGATVRVHVHGRGAATVYEVRQGESWELPFQGDLERGLFGVRGTAPLAPCKAVALETVQAHLRHEGLAAGLRFLNARVPHRFTALYRLQDKTLRNVALIDKERGADTVTLQEVPLADSFCQFVLKDGLFLTPDSGQDPRLPGHPYSGVVGSYVGVPVVSDEPKFFGTLCHFDYDRHEVSDEEFLFLERVARLLPRFLPA
jgi:GAF domain-containing protein